MNCPSGKIRRNSYTRKTSSGKTIRVKSNCIKAQSQSGKKRSDIDRKIMSRQSKEHKIARQKFGTPRCKKGEVIREGFFRRNSRNSRNSSRRSSRRNSRNSSRRNSRNSSRRNSRNSSRRNSRNSSRRGSWVAPTCIKARGQSRQTGKKGKKLFRLESGTLGEFGYSDIKNMSKKERRASLNRALESLKPLTVQRKLNAVSILQRNTNPKLSEIMREDMEWVRDKRNK
jgi:hypothetical protein